jgi:hypothetical protein
MKKEELEKIKDKLIDVLSQEKGYFGRVDTWGQRPTKYEHIGYELDLDIMPTIESLSEKDRKCLVKIINYFEIHANPLRKMIEGDSKQGLYDFYSEWAWSHFMTVVMFGMLEVAVKNTPSCIVWRNQQKGHIEKYKSIELFLETNLSQNIRDDIAKRYKTENNLNLNSFSDVIKHLWNEIRSGFIHEAGVHYKGMEWSTFGGGMGTKEDPIKLQTDVPMQELLQITWQSILNSFGYSGLLKLPRYQN